MFLVKDRRLGMDKYVFLYADPRPEGYRGEVTEGVTLDYDMNGVHLWPDGQPCPNPQLGRDPNDPKHYQVFKFPEELNAAAFRLVHSSTPIVAYSWSEYRKRYYPVPEDYAKSMTQDEWFDFLEEADSATRIRKKLIELNNPRHGSKRNEIAEWVANRHMGADGGINQVWFLDSGSPAEEIRLLEVSERFTGEAARIEPIDLGLDVDGKNYKLLVADISSEHLEKIRKDPARMLPKDWMIENALVWGRRGRQQ